MGHLEFGQARGNIPDAIPFVNETTTLLAGGAIVILLVGVVVFVLVGNYSQTGSLWDFGSQARPRRSSRRRPK